ncbi:MAG: deoxyribose-phosphate aldolase [Firmicutes bacterium]|nr:deoxyribose-phosphate aldolase [Bacillota bacterium]
MLTPEHIDYTLLKPEAGQRQIEEHCTRAIDYGFAAVCIFPQWVPLAKAILDGTPVKVCTVIGFPFGANTRMVKSAEAAEALEQGAAEIDMVINLGAIKSGDHRRASQEIETVAGLVRWAGEDKVLKVILETCLLDDSEKRDAARLAEAAGAHFVKTSTGFGPGGATVEDVRLLREAVFPQTRIKASGGIRGLDTALALIAAGADRLGTSAGVELMQSWRSSRGIL